MKGRLFLRESEGKFVCMQSFCRRKSGVTLLELSVVIMVILLLIGILFVGTQGWKSGANRTLCIMNIRNIQSGVRSVANLYGHSAGDSVVNLQAEFIGPGMFVEVFPECPSSGTYSYGGSSGENTIPPIGELYLDCSLAGDGHIPTNFEGW